MQNPDYYYANIRLAIKAVVVTVVTACALIFGYHVIDGKGVGCPTGQAEVYNAAGSSCYPIISINVDNS